MAFGSFFSLTGIGFLLFCVCAVAALGYALGRVTVKGVNLGTAGVFIVALLFGCFFPHAIEGQLMLSGVSYANNALKIIENLGLVLFVTAVGFIAGPNFFAGLKKNFKSYIALGVLIIVSSALVCVLCVVLFGCESSMAVGILSGALTSTPAFSAAKETVAAVYANGGAELVQKMEESAIEPENQTVFISHGDCYEDAKYVADKIRAKFGTKKFEINFVGPVIGGHAGPGVVALFFFGKQR